MSNNAEKTTIVPEDDDDEPDDWDKRIFSTGCHTEQDKMNDCYFAKKDWRECKNELFTPFNALDKQPSFDDPNQGHNPVPQTYIDCNIQMEAFRECWKRQGNDQRTQTKDA